jgi:hypothetical protein
MDDLEPFESPKLLIDGAKTSIIDFKSTCDAFIQASTYDVVNHVDPKTGDQIVKLRFHHRVPPKLRVPASGIVNNLRHALDQAVCDGAIKLGRANAKGVYFPLVKRPRILTTKSKQGAKTFTPNSLPSSARSTLTTEGMTCSMRSAPLLAQTNTNVFLEYPAAMPALPLAGAARHGHT